MKNEANQFLIYRSEDGRTRIDVMLEAETLWLSQKQLGELFGKVKGTISEHIKHIFDDGELSRDATVRFYRVFKRGQTTLHGPVNNFEGSRLHYP